MSNQYAALIMAISRLDAARDTISGAAKVLHQNDLGEFGRQLMELELEIGKKIDQWYVAFEAACAARKHNDELTDTTHL